MKNVMVGGMLLLLFACESNAPQQTAATTAPARCSAEVTDGNGRFWAIATASAKAPAAPLQKQAVASACEQLCLKRQADDAPAAKGCKARCLVDIRAAKVGVRVSCTNTAGAAAASASAAHSAARQ